MSLLLKNLYNATKDKYRLRLLCGQQGLSRELAWFYYTEDMHTMDYIHRGNLVVTTGMTSSSGPLLRQFVEEVMKRDTVGLIINVGRYIKESDIDEELLAFCENRHYPIFTLPWDIHLSDIMQDYLNRILSAEKNERDLIKAFMNAIRTPALRERYDEDISLSPFGHMKKFRIVFFSFEGPGLSEDIEQHILLEGKSLMNESGTPYLFFSSFQNFLLILCGAACEKAEEQALHIHDIFLRSSVPCRAGIGTPVSSPEELWKSCRQAQGAAAAAGLWNKSVLSFDHLGVFQLLFSINDNSLLKQYQDRLLGPLIDHDCHHHTSLCDTLHLYLKNSGSLNAAAESSFTHRNTINYRMKQIRNLLHCDLSDADTRMEYLMAYTVREYFKMTEHPS